MNLPEPQSVTFPSLFDQIRNGSIKIPQFQREFVWSLEKSAALLDSVVKGYPIGAFIFWATRDRLRSVRDLGNVWPAPGSEDTELGVLMELEVGHGETEVYARVQA